MSEPSLNLQIVSPPARDETAASALPDPPLWLDGQGLAALFAFLPVPVFAKNLEGRYIAGNAAFGQFLGVSAADLLGKSVFDLAAPEFAHHFHRADLALLQAGGVQTYESQVACVDGRLAQVIYHNAVFYDPAGEPAGIVGCLTDITEQRSSEQALLQAANFDPLTGLINRSHLEKRLQLLLSAPNTLPLAVLSLDLDRFKLVNETIGHALANQLLQAIAKKLAEVMRNCDLLSRSNRDEFILVLPQLIHRQYVDYIVARILAVLATPFDIEGHQIYCTASIGIALAPDDGACAHELLQKTETALFLAKGQGKNQCRFYDQEMEAGTAERLTLETALRGALNRQEISLHYQPQVDLQSGRITGVEALARWQHSEWGAISPGKFIPVAEDSGLIIPLGNWVLNTACRQAKTWQHKGLPPVRVAVNVSGHQFQQADFVDIVASALLDSDLDPACLELELTESTIMERTEENISTLKRLKGLGVQLAIDDFGTGYSSLSYLKRFPIDRIKIDRSFIMNIPGDADDAAITDAVIALAHSLRYKVVAEGVETQQQLDYLRSRQCDEMQGYLFGKPIPATEMTSLLKWGRSLP
ncbi:MAG: putative bifunctional diguanylate cyclase/phosphodiesterase [Trichloromonadaceae bacterium]